jgi:xanthine dehydrogenase YagR molybdenum-binding subunit
MSIKDALQAVMAEAVALAPDSWMPGGKPDPIARRKHGLVGSPTSRLDGPLKVRGQARFPAEIAMDGMAYAALVFSTIPKGRIMGFDTAAAQAAPGVVLVMTHHNAPHGADSLLHAGAKIRCGRQPARPAGRSGALERPAGGACAG